MSKPIAYVLGGPTVPERPADPTLRPRAEFQVFTARNGSTLLATNDAAGARSVLSRLVRPIHSPGLSLAAFMRERIADFCAVLASGEDIGIPVALASLGQTAVPVCVILHGHFAGGRKFAAAIALLRRSAPHVHLFCLSRPLRDRMLREFGFPPDRCHDTGYGVDTAFFQPADAVAGEGPVVSAGLANRDYTTLIEAVRPLSAPLKVAADSAWFPGVPELGTRSLPEHVEVRSYGDYRSLRDLYAHARFVVVPMHPCGHACGYAVIAEAMAMGKAVIATRTDAPSDFLEDGVNGFYVRAGDVGDLRRRIAFLLECPDLAVAMGASARARMVGQFSVEQYCARMEQAMSRARALQR